MTKRLGIGFSAGQQFLRESTNCCCLLFLISSVLVANPKKTTRYRTHTCTLGWNYFLGMMVEARSVPK